MLLRGIIYILISILLIVFTLTITFVSMGPIKDIINLFMDGGVSPGGWIIIEIEEGEWILINIGGDEPWLEKLRSILQ